MRNSKPHKSAPKKKPKKIPSTENLPENEDLKEEIKEEIKEELPDQDPDSESSEEPDTWEDIATVWSREIWELKRTSKDKDLWNWKLMEILQERER